MAGRGVVLASRILNEIAALELIVTKVERAWKAAGANNDDLYYDSVALNIHSFYSGLEKIFEKVASAVDGSVRDKRYFIPLLTYRDELFGIHAPSSAHRCSWCLASSRHPGVDWAVIFFG